MRLTKFSLFLRQSITYLLAIVLGAFLTVGVYRVLPSQAGPVPTTDSEVPTLLAQRQPITDPATRGSFVTAAVDRVGPAVVRIDTERTITRRVDPFFDDPSFRRFFRRGLFPPDAPRTTLAGSRLRFHY